MFKRKCCVPGCMDLGRSSPTMHFFPNPAKERERFTQWVLAIGGDIIGFDNDYIYKNRYVCHIHFEEKFCCRFNRISNTAVPTLNLPRHPSFSNLIHVGRRPMQQIQDLSHPSTSAGSGLFMDWNTSTELETVTLKENLDPIVMKTMEDNKNEATQKIDTEPVAEPLSTSVEKLTLKKNPEKAISVPSTSTSGRPERNAGRRFTKTLRKPTFMDAEEQTLHRKLIHARIKLSKCRNKVKRQSASLKAAKNIVSNPGILATLEKLPSTAKLLTMMQIREVAKRDKGRRFTLSEKLLALSIFKQTPKGYRFLRKMLILPAPQTLVKLINQANINPGINKNIFRQLKNVANKMKVEERLCILLFDEMHLKANISFNERKDRIIGFATDGKETKPDFADNAQVFMIRGLVKNFKQPISYSFSAAATRGEQICAQLKRIIKELQDAGMIVVATVCDQGTNNRQAIKLLLQETRGIYLRRGEQPKEHIILINDQEVIPLYDPPHLLKCIRNNLLTKNLQVTEDGVIKTAKWEHLKLLHQENPGYKGVRLIPKLTDHHVIPDKIAKSKMKVKYASQVFSSTVAGNMGYYAGKGILPEECKDTADVLLFFDKLFDSHNGSYNKKEVRFAKPLLGPVTPTSAHHALWTQAKKLLKTMKFVNLKSGVAENVPTLKNWAWTLEGTEVLLKKLTNEYQITSVWMRHLNQDPIENFFGCIRSHGCRNTNPTPQNFEGAFTALLINNLSSVHAPAGANCEQDHCETLHSLIVNDCEATTTNLDFMPNIILENIEAKQDPRIMGPLHYVSGYFVKQVKNKVFKACKKCSKDLIRSQESEFIKYREYAGRRWLCSPTDSIVECISAIQDINNLILREYISKNNLKELIKTHILMFLDFDFLKCNKHKDMIIENLINITSRFFVFNYCKDLNKILTGRQERIDCDDKLQNMAHKYFKKCFKRK